MATSFNPSDAINCTLTNSNLSAQASATPSLARVLDPQFTGKFYVEWTKSGSQNSGNAVGIASNGATPFGFQNSGVEGAICKWVGSTWVNGSSIGSLGLFWTTCDMAVDLTNQRIWFRTDNGNWNGSAGNNPATNVGGYDISVICNAGVLPAVAFNATAGIFTGNFSTAVRTVPAGFTTGWPTTPSGVNIDPVAVGSNSGAAVSSLTASLTTSDTNRIVSVIVYISDPGTAPTVSGVTDTAGLTWTLRKRYQWESNHSCIEEWWAKAPTKLTADTVTVTLTGSCDCLSLVTLAIWGPASSAHQPFQWYFAGHPGGTLVNAAYDANVSLPASANGSSTAPSVGGVTTSGEDMILAIFGCGSASNVGSAGGSAPVIQGAGLSGVASVRKLGSLRSAYITVAAKYKPSIVSGDTETMSTLNASGAWGMVADAFTSAPPLVGTVANLQAVIIG